MFGQPSNYLEDAGSLLGDPLRVADHHEAGFTTTPMIQSSQVIPSMLDRDVNANQVFSWRRRYGPAAEAVAPPAPPAPRPRLVPVMVSTEPEMASPPSCASASDSAIEIEVTDVYRVRVGANFDGRVLRRVLDCLGRTGGAREKSR